MAKPKKAATGRKPISVELIHLEPVDVTCLRINGKMISDKIEDARDLLEALDGEIPGVKFSSGHEDKVPKDSVYYDSVEDEDREQ